MRNTVGITAGAWTDYHIPGVSSDYATLCGMDGSDPSVGHLTTGGGKKITCQQCFDIWQAARKVKRSDFDRLLLSMNF